MSHLVTGIGGPMRTAPTAARPADPCSAEPSGMGPSRVSGVLCHICLDITLDSVPDPLGQAGMQRPAPSLKPRERHVDRNVVVLDRIERLHHRIQRKRLKGRPSPPSVDLRLHPRACLGGQAFRARRIITRHAGADSHQAQVTGHSSRHPPTRRQIQLHLRAPGELLPKPATGHTFTLLRGVRQRL